MGKAAKSPGELSTSQIMMLQGVIPVLLVGILLPIGLVAAFLALQDNSVRDSVKHGELFLASGNSAFTGCLVLVSSRRDQPVNAMIATLVTTILLVVPSYACWAFLTVQEILGKDYSTAFALYWGSGFAAASVVVALVFVWLSCPTPALRPLITSTR